MTAMEQNRPENSTEQAAALGVEAMPAPTDRPGGAATPVETLNDRVIAALREVFDPEIPVNIYDLGLIYNVDDEPGGAVEVRMTLTAPACPVAGTMPDMVKDKVASVEGVTAVNVDLVWEPAWNPEMMSEAAKLQLGFM